MCLQRLLWSACLPLRRWRPTNLMGMQDYCQCFAIRFGVTYLRVVRKFSFYSAVDSSAWLAQNGSLKPVPCWQLAREGPFLTEITRSGVAGFRPWKRLLLFYTPVFGLCSALWKVWAAFAPPPLSGMGWRSGVGASAG